MAIYLLLKIHAQFFFYQILFNIPKLVFNPFIIGGVSDIRLSVSFSVVGDVYSGKIKVYFKKKKENNFIQYCLKVYQIRQIMPHNQYHVLEYQRCSLLILFQFLNIIINEIRSILYLNK
jgi:hypothetical protein